MLLLGNSFSPARCATMVPALHCAGEAPICAHRYICTTKCYERIYVFFIWASFKHSLQNFISEPTCWLWMGFVPFGFSIVPVFATFMPTWTTKDLQDIYCLKNNLILYDMCLSLNVHYHLIMIYVDFELSPISCCDLSTIDNNYISYANFKKSY